METYFWSFIVALMVFLLGGVLSVYEGVRQILEPEPVVSPWISLGVLAIAAAFEGNRSASPIGNTVVSCADGPPACGTSSRDRRTRHCSRCCLRIPRRLAAIGVVAATFFQVTWADGIASIAIGLLLASVAFVLANETRSLIAGEAVAPIVMERLREALSRIGCITSLDEVRLCILGPGRFW